jgi:hypothetical protein
MDKVGEEVEVDKLSVNLEEATILVYSETDCQSRCMPPPLMR